MTADGGTFEPADWAEHEEEVLAPYAMRTRQSRGRVYPEAAHGFRTPYQRDRDRIIHSTAFRRLMYKTQVLAAPSNDHHRTRLTHTLEVAQISRTIARRLGLNEDLTEAMALAHDLGHPPFGHAGEEALDEAMAGHGGFEHNWHGLRIVDLLEYRYAGFPGLNLTREVREAAAYHSKRRTLPEVEALISTPQPPLEAQVVDAADSLAYDTHDVDDALGVGILEVADLEGVPFWRQAVERARQRYGELGRLQFQPAVVRVLIDWQVTDLLANTTEQIRRAGVNSVEEVRRLSEPLVRPGAEVRELKGGLERFLHERVYQHHRVMRMASKGQRIVRALFGEFRAGPRLLPERYQERVPGQGLERTVCDYIAGMTDRFAQDEFLRLFQPYTSV